MEMLFVLAIIALISLTGLGFHRHLIEKEQKNNIIEQLVQAMEFSRNQAWLKDGKLALRPTKGMNWADGFQLMDEHQQTIYEWAFNFPGWDIRWKGFSSNNEIPVSSSPQSAIMNGHFIIENIQKGVSTILLVNRLGKMRVSDKIINSPKT